MNKEFIKEAGWLRIIIWLCLLTFFVVAPFVGVSINVSLSKILEQFVMNVILALAMVPMIRSGCGLNFGLPLGVMAGLLGALISLEFCPTGLSSVAKFGVFTIALCIAVLIAAALGYCYGKLLNRVKGYEMITSVFVGLFTTALMPALWLTLPFKNPMLIFSSRGEGLRGTITLSEFWGQVLNEFLAIEMGSFTIPAGTLLFISAVFFLAQYFMRIKTGVLMVTAESNSYSHTSVINTERARLFSVMLSTILGAVGVIVYVQSFGFIVLHRAYYTFPAVASIILGGASVNKASIWNAIVGTFLYFGCLTMRGSSILSEATGANLGNIILIIIGGIILCSFTGKVQVEK